MAQATTVMNYAVAKITPKTDPTMPLVPPNSNYHQPTHIHPSQFPATPQHAFSSNPPTYSGPSTSGPPSYPASTSNPSPHNQVAANNYQVGYNTVSSGYGQQGGNSYGSPYPQTSNVPNYQTQPTTANYGAPHPHPAANNAIAYQPQLMMGTATNYTPGSYPAANNMAITSMPENPPKSNAGNCGPIMFYNANESFYEFTNFFAAPITLDGKTWPTSEHYFQAQKFETEGLQEEIRSCLGPREAFDYARRMNGSKRHDWEKVKEDIMYRAVLAKFLQHDQLLALLLSTGDALLVEHTSNDSYWGDGGDGKGQNKLGLILMRIRAEVSQGQRNQAPHESIQAQRRPDIQAIHDSIRRDLEKQGITEQEYLAYVKALP